MNSTTNSTIESTSCCDNSFIVNVLDTHINGTINVLVFITNSFCVLVFARILLYKRTDGLMFKYLFVKALCDTLIGASNVFYLTRWCTYYCGLKYSYVTNFWKMFVNYYVMVVLFQVSYYMEIAATFDCYIGIYKKLPFCQKGLCFYSSLAAITIFSVVFFIPKLFYMTIIETAVNVTNGNNFHTETHYNTDYLPFYHSELDKTYRVFIAILQDVLSQAILIVINIFILKIMRQATERKKVLQRTASSSRHTERAIEAENSKMRMIMATGVVYFIGRLPKIVYNLSFHPQTGVWSCYTIICDTFKFSSLMFPLLFYIAFNRIFKKSFMKILFVRNCHLTTSARDIEMTSYK